MFKNLMLLVFVPLSLAHADAEDPTGFFKSAAEGVTACYKAVEGKMPKTFDKSGVCEGLGKSIWEVKEPDKSIRRKLFRFIATEGTGDDKGAGKYLGLVAFDHRNDVCHFRMEAEYTGEDSSVTVEDEVECVSLASIRKKAGRIAAAIAESRGTTVDGRCVFRTDRTLVERVHGHEHGGGALYIYFNVAFGRRHQGECPDPHYSLDLLFDLQGEYFASFVNDF